MVFEETDYHLLCMVTSQLQTSLSINTCSSRYSSSISQRSADICFIYKVLATRKPFRRTTLQQGKISTCHSYLSISRPLSRLSTIESTSHSKSHTTKLIPNSQSFAFNHYHPTRCANGTRSTTYTAATPSAQSTNARWARTTAFLAKTGTNRRMSVAL